ncbi:MAG: DEAD/DEAH box helicase, partial [Gammaproteobacteria bacterium]|nr:DEAD/DEAH box helicase [Gammaproteobacteria bacterium]
MGTQVPRQASQDVDAVERLVARLLRKYRDRICAELTVPAQAANTVDLPDDLLPPLRRALAARGVTRLYTHQAEAWQLAQARRHFVVVTPTASGKTLCYNLPVLQTIAAEGGKALYLFPTK